MGRAGYFLPQLRTNIGVQKWKVVPMVACRSCCMGSHDIMSAAKNQERRRKVKRSYDVVQCWGRRRLSTSGGGRCHPQMVPQGVHPPSAGTVVPVHTKATVCHTSPPNGPNPTGGNWKALPDSPTSNRLPQGTNATALGWCNSRVATAPF